MKLIPGLTRLGLMGLVALAGLFPAIGAGTAAADDDKRIEFDMVPSATAVGAGCLSDAMARVTIESKGPVEHMDVHVSGLPPKTEFDFFVIQIPNAPFGLAWYQGDIETNHEGRGHQKFIGRFNIETFIVAQQPAGQPAPVVHDQPPFPDAASNPATEPIHTFHLGLWFNSPVDAANAGVSWGSHQIQRGLPSLWTMHMRINQVLSWHPLTNDHRPVTR